MSTISVVIPCYNVAPYIKEAIESVIQQTKPCEEIICVDDCSSDTTVTIIKELQNQYPTIIKLLQNEKNEGANYSRNKGLHAATGEFVQFFDADDLLLPTKFEHQLSLIEKSNNSIDIVVNNFKKRSLSGVDTLYNFESDDAWNSLILFSKLIWAVFVQPFFIPSSFGIYQFLTIFSI